MGEQQLSVEVRGRQRVRNVASGCVLGLAALAALGSWSRSWGAPSAAACLRADQVVQAAGVAYAVGLVLLGVRALELVVLPRPGTAGSRERTAAVLGLVGLVAVAVALTGLGLAVAQTVGAATADLCTRDPGGTGVAGALTVYGLVAGTTIALGLVLWSLFDLPRGEGLDVPDAWAHRLAPAEADPSAGPGGTVICCSGGGIRSAAFCLGGLQALDATPAPGAAAGANGAAPSIYAGAREVVGVSGGGYMAAAWHVARHPRPPGPGAARSRTGGRRAAHGGPGEGGGRGAALAGPKTGTTEHEQFTLDPDPEQRPFGAASPELRRLRRNTTYLVSSGRVRADAVLSWVFGTALMWAVSLSALALTAWGLALFADRLGLASKLATQDADTWPPHPTAVVIALGVMSLGPLLFIGRRLWQMRASREDPGRVPDAILNTVLPAIAAGTVIGALLVGVPGAAVLLHDTTVRNQPVPLVAGVVHTLGFATPSACDAATSDDVFKERYRQEQARAGAVGHPVTFSFGACGSEVEVSADPAVKVETVTTDARTALSFAPGVWQQLAASGAALTLFGGLVRSMVKGRSPQQPTGRGGGALTFVRRRVAPWLATVLVVATGFLLLIKWLDDNLLTLQQGGTGPWHGYAPPLVFFGLLLLLKLGTSATWMSMHPYYRDRLRSAYLLRRRTLHGEVQVEPVEDRDLEFAHHAGVPDLVLCGTANLSDDELVPSGRQGAPFLFSEKAVGFDDPSNLPPGGAAAGATYAATTRDVRISAAIAISGAALAPVMGRENANVRPFRLLMSLCNVRTGVWLPNPYWVESIATGRRAGGLREVVTRLGQSTGVPGVGSVLREGLGWTSLMSRHIYVTDGGQIENLGLVVALRRRPSTVYVLDASGDPPDTFSTLAHAMAMARIDSGVEFEDLDLAPLERDGQGYSRSGSTTATIRYADGSQGRLVYVKALATRGLPWDVEGFRKVDGVFPDTGTEDQLYGEFEFEAFRELGWVLTRRALEPPLPPALQVGPRGPAVVDLRDGAAAGDAAPAPGTSSG